MHVLNVFHRYVPKTSLSSPPWPEVVLPDPVEETRHHTEVVGKVNELIATGQYGRLFAVVHFAGHQWKVTSEDLILVENGPDVACGERIRLEKVLLVGAENFTLLGKPLLGKDLVRIEATVIERTESWPKINMKFKRRKNYRKKKSKLEKVPPAPCPGVQVCQLHAGHRAGHRWGSGERARAGLSAAAAAHCPPSRSGGGA
ncbi:PREDICTED: 39S ribosomal protein L21, mitochondrial isoform X1 [Propithecus coquereli]|uniref:39S ribosomal protein L21, mitochondrial isoform X1 n=1 Tax=Propithecus coquereli TaxID=379532 RepID=UPI00063F7895|nr:PREDICTED: 39S ribosomal protein L21, mitochondrial isoform X1 [Propithecus coquereli]